MHGDVGKGVRTYHVIKTFSNLTTPLKKLKQNSHKLVKCQIWFFFCFIVFFALIAYFIFFVPHLLTFEDIKMKKCEVMLKMTTWTHQQLNTEESHTDDR